MRDRANDILVYYEGLCGQLTDVLEVLGVATAYNQPTASAIINTTCHALQKIIADHTKQAKDYRKGDTHD